jgi:hypothetical protein
MTYGQMIKRLRLTSIHIAKHIKCQRSNASYNAYLESCIRAAIEELLLPGAGAEQRDTLRTFDSLEEASTEHYPGPRPFAADLIIRRP